jgi:hypothetical protein
MRLELLAVATPGRPELHQHRRLADVLREIRRLSVERLDRRRRRLRPDLNSRFLRMQARTGSERDDH